MDAREIEFQKRLIATFQEEVAERLQNISTGLIDLERSPEKAPEILEALVREAHSIKGAARAVNLSEIEALARAMEAVLAALKKQEIAVSAALLDLLHQSENRAGKLLSAVDEQRTPPEKAELRQFIETLEGAAAAASDRAKSEEPKPEQAKPEQAKPEQAKPEQAKPEAAVETAPVAQASSAPDSVVIPEKAAQTVRIPTQRLAELLLEAEQLLSAKLAAENFIVEMRQAERGAELARKELGKLRQSLQSMVGREQIEPLFVQSDHYAAQLEDRLERIGKLAEQHYRFIGSAVGNLLEDIKGVLMLPFSVLLQGFPKLVRELSRDQGKDVDFLIEGEDIEVDKRILDELRDPLIHLARNSIDHGIESPAERQRKNKPQRGKFKLSLSQRETGKVEIEVFDDGAGIDFDRLRSAAVRHGVLSAKDAANLSDFEAKSLVFRSGVTTSPIVTDISGRGLGLAIVQEKVSKLNGVLSYETRPDFGTSFKIVLPVTLATFRGVLVEVLDHWFVIPTANVEQVLRIRPEQIRMVENRETIELAGRAVSLARLGQTLELPARAMQSGPNDKLHVVVLASNERRIGFLVDGIINEQEVLVKPLGRQLARVRNIAGAAVLGTGRVAPIINVHDLLASAIKQASVQSIGFGSESGERDSVSRVLVVEDSITTRVLLKNILEAEGFDVETAVDGVDGFSKLQTADFNLVVSDVMMPRMNGFDLTAKIRADAKLSQLPVILVTSMESREDRERGIDVGANAYIVKSSFDQSNLIETIGRLI